MKDGLKVAIVGATGAVGRELLSLLAQRRFPVRELVLFASQRSIGKSVIWNGENYVCQALSKDCFGGVQVAFFDASDEVSQEWVPCAAAAGAWVIDNSATFRLQEQVPLLVPEVNAHFLEQRLRSKPLSQLSAQERILAGPNCSTVQLVLALNPIHDHWGLKRVLVSSYQSTSGAGSLAMSELAHQTEDFLAKKPLQSRVFPHPIAFNCIPQIGTFKEDGYTSEEHKIMAESRKILGLPDLRISATAVRVPTFSCHAEAIHVECQRSFSIPEVISALQNHPGLIVQDNLKKNSYPLAIATENDSVEGATGKDAVYVGRIRKDPSVENGLNLWVVSDNLRKGAALNAIQMGELLLKALQ